MLCKGCRAAQARENDPFCSDECADLYAHGKQKRRCRHCGNEFLRYVTQKANVCPRCHYMKHYAPPKSPARRANVPEPPDGIGDMAAEQRRIYEETGRWLTYGEMIAMKEGKK